MLRVFRVLRQQRRLLLLVFGAIVIVTGCNLQLEVEIRVEDDGSGTVTAGVGLDADAQARFPDRTQLLVTSDLTAAGWDVRPPRVRQDGREWIEAEKDFANPNDLQAVLNELFGASSGVFTDWEIVRTGTRTQESFDVVGTVDLTDGLTLFSDDALNSVIDIAPIGYDIAALEAELGEAIEDTVQMRIVIRLPGGGDEQTFDVAMGDSLDIVASSTAENRVAQLLGWVKTALLILVGISVALALLNYWLDRRHERSRPERRPQTVSDRVPQAAGAGGAAQPAGASSRMQMIVLDAHDVLFRVSPDPLERLVPFVREHRGTATDAEIIEYHRQATLGRLHSAAFWQAVGVQGDPGELDARLLSGVRIQHGAKEFLREMHRRGVPVAVLTNDLAEWSYRLRDLHGMSGVAPWIVSSDIGVRKPDPAAFEALRRVTGVPYHSMLLVDGQIPALDMVKSLGVMTAWFAPHKPPDDIEPGHAVITKFAEFFRRRRPPEPATGGRRRSKK